MTGICCRWPWQPGRQRDQVHEPGGPDRGARPRGGRRRGGRGRRHRAGHRPGGPAHIWEELYRSPAPASGPRQRPGSGAGPGRRRAARRRRSRRRAGSATAPWCGSSCRAHGPARAREPRPSVARPSEGGGPGDVGVLPDQAVLAHRAERPRPQESRRLVRRRHDDGGARSARRPPPARRPPGSTVQCSSDRAEPPGPGSASPAPVTRDPPEVGRHALAGRPEQAPARRTRRPCRCGLLVLVSTTVA